MKEEPVWIQKIIEMYVEKNLEWPLLSPITTNVT
jgi:hypothetical protein